jgi:hypothetical protein
MTAPDLSVDSLNLLHIGFTRKTVSSNIGTSCCENFESKSEFVSREEALSMVQHDFTSITFQNYAGDVNTLRTGSFKLFKRPFPGFLTILTL